MADEIIGISVLQPIWIDGIYRLWFTGRKDDGSKAQTCIYIKDVRSQGLPDEIKYECPTRPGCAPQEYQGVPRPDPIWKFERAPGNRLNCHPSVNWISWGFHNTLHWSTDYVEAVRREENTYEEAPRYHRGSALHYDINSSDLAFARGLICDLRAEGFLKLPA